MTNRLSSIISSITAKQFATNTGNTMHAKLQFVKIGQHSSGDPELIKKIESNNNGLKSFFAEQSKTEVPIAGYINNRFVSRRVDRLVVDNTTKTVKILDYKTDATPNDFRPKYIAQLQEYKSLLQQIYPGYRIETYILWLHNWILEQI